jgi:bifunctional non-homologous end joining protein LigD
LRCLRGTARPNFNLLQNYRSDESHIIYYAFDVLTLKGRDLTKLPLFGEKGSVHSILQTNEHVDISVAANTTAAEMIAFVRGQGIEGVVAKRSDSVYQPGKRTGWG